MELKGDRKRRRRASPRERIIGGPQIFSTRRE
jgi:hypothetical protein